MPFISRGKTIGFKRVGPFELSLRDLLIDLSSKKFIGRIVFDGRVGNDTVLIRIEMNKNRVVGLEIEKNGRLLVGTEAIPILEQALDRAEGYAEIIELDEHKVEIDLEENPMARVSLTISAPVELRNLVEFHAAAKGDLTLLYDALSQIETTSCLRIEGLLGGEECQGAIKGEMCPDKIAINISVGTDTIVITSLDEFKGALSSANEKCNLLELYAKKE
ncbi:hypothetical protein IPA_09615 [Ignicoccus pacificus DSM 13166]|uniref:Uncharacterized protein n=1 Tax=Ignicoccus pacificus DSM 13166 TaxID=940294 RepID=A0A977PM29_9CREN|nr:hypothetical protein IPA_09615 [Ignicoccus pacificus DSM 13166]